MVDGSANRISHREGNRTSKIHPVIARQSTSALSKQSITTGGTG